jgi:hypothetical protein
MPKEGIPHILYQPGNIDSIKIERNDSVATIKDRVYISKISAALENSTAIPSPERINIHTGRLNIYFFTKRGKKYLEIIYCYYDGVVIKSNFDYYRNDPFNEQIIDGINLFYQKSPPTNILM